MSYVYITPDDVKPEFGAWTNRKEWCEKNCQGAWKYMLQGKFVFYNEKDYEWFLLRWS
jgi:hypothetical protein